MVCVHMHIYTYVGAYVYVYVYVYLYISNKYSLRTYHMVGTGDKGNSCPKGVDILVWRDKTIIMSKTR